MKTFSEFLNEISVNTDMVVPSSPAQLRQSGNILPSEDAHSVIPLVMHPRTLDFLKDLGDLDAPPPAAKLLDRFAQQPSDGAPVAVNASNLEVSSLRDYARGLASGSDSMFRGDFGNQVKDDAFRGASFANELLRMLDEGESTASGKMLRQKHI